jgi:CBS domain-containing protein
MKVEQIMTRDVIAVAPDAPIKDAAHLLVENGISGLPVVDASGTVVGILSEGDLIVRQKPRERLPWWRLFFAEGEELARQYQKSMGTTVAEVMTRSVICVTPDLPIESAAALLDEHRIRRLPVVAAGKLVGIVSRGDLVRALAATAPIAEGTPPSDAELVGTMRARLRGEAWVSCHGLLIEARDGVLVLWGLVATDTEKSAIETMARSIPGVRGVDSHLMVRAEIPYSYGV